MNSESFWIWFECALPTLSVSHSTEMIVDRIDREVSQIDERIGVEVSENDSHGTREVIFSSNGNEELFPIIEDLVNSAPEFSGWRFLALKPDHGFDFTYRQPGLRLSPSSWSFLPLRDGDKNLGLRIFIPGTPINISGNVLRRILETGVGERALSRVQHVEYVQDPDALKSDTWLAITKLAEFMRRESHKNFAV